MSFVAGQSRDIGTADESFAARAVAPPGHAERTNGSREAPGGLVARRFPAALLG